MSGPGVIFIENAILKGLQWPIVVPTAFYWEFRLTAYIVGGFAVGVGAAYYANGNPLDTLMSGNLASIAVDYLLISAGTAVGVYLAETNGQVSP